MNEVGVARLIDSYALQSETLRQALLRVLTARWVALPDYSDASIAQWVAEVSPLLEAAQSKSGSLTAAYLAQLEAAVTGETANVVSLTARQLTTQALRGVDVKTLLTRAGVSVWRSLSEGHSIETAADAGLTRATSLAETGVQLARTHASLHSLKRNERVVGYRRVLRGAHTCALCAVAATQRYHRADLMPIHPGCHCSVAPLIGKADTGQVIEQAQLDAVHASLANAGLDSNSSEELRQLVVVNHHGEIGPVLGVRGQQFTGPEDIAA